MERSGRFASGGESADAGRRAAVDRTESRRAVYRCRGALGRRSGFGTGTGFALGAICGATPAASPRGLARQGELILHERARIELLPWFITHHLPWGVRGLVLAAVVSALLATVDAGLNSLATMGLMHGDCELGWWRGGLAYVRQKPIATWKEYDELFAARGLVFILGTLLTLTAAFCSALQLDGRWLIGNLSCLGAPLLAVFLLGLFSRRTTSRGALAALGGGLVLALVLLLLSLGSDLRGLDLDGLSDLDPRRPTSRFLPISALPLTLLGSLFLGLLASRWGDRPKSKNELRGLVVGLRPLGDLKKIALGKSDSVRSA